VACVLEKTTHGRGSQGRASERSVAGIPHAGNPRQRLLNRRTERSVPPHLCPVRPDLTPRSTEDRSLATLVRALPQDAKADVSRAVGEDGPVPSFDAERHRVEVVRATL